PRRLRLDEPGPPARLRVAPRLGRAHPASDRLPVAHGLVADFHVRMLVLGGGRASREAHRLRPDAKTYRLVGGDEDVVEVGARTRMVAPEMRAAALRALERAAGDEPGRRHLVLEIHPVLPGEVEGGPTRHCHRGRARADVLRFPEG